MEFLKWLWQYIKAFFKAIGKWLVRYPLAAAIAVIVIVGGFFMLVMGKDVQIGGLLGKLFGKQKKKDARGIPPKERTDEDGDLIPPGESDEEGYVQAPVIQEIKKPGLFDDPDTITVVHPEKGDVVIELPKGIKNKDVQEVIEIHPEIYEVRNNDRGVNTDYLLGILEDEHTSREK